MEIMKKRFRIISTLILMSIACQSYAQYFYMMIIPYTPPRNMLYDSKPLGSNYIPWSKYDLNTTLLHGIRQNSDMQDLYMSYYSRPELTEKKIGNTKYRYYTNASYIYALDSWINKESNTPNIKEICQINFDLREMCSRKALIDYNTNGNMNIEDNYATYDNEFTRLSNEFEEAISIDNDTDKLNAVSDSIKKKIDSLTFDPEAAVANLEDNSGWTWGFGIESHMPFSEYVSMGYGFGFNGGCIQKRNLLGFDINIEFFEKCQENIVTSKGTIYEGENMMSGAMCLFYGYRATNNKSVNLTPFVNTGARFYMGGKPNYSRYWNDTNEKAGFTLGAGVMIDVPLSRKIDIRIYDKDEISRSTGFFRIKPYFSMTNFSGDMGWTPSFNIAIEYSFTSLKLK